MNPLQADTEALARSSQELDVARARLAEVVEAYHTTERSKFARLRNVVRAIRSLLTSGPALPTSIAVGSTSLTHASVAATSAVKTVPSVSQIRSPYEQWLERNSLRDADIVRIRAAAKQLSYRPVISVLMAAYNTPDQYLRQAIDSVRVQAYVDWELCIADDASTDARVRETLDSYAAIDARIRIVKRSTNGHISEASNSALAIATGEFVGFLDHDDLLTPDALFEVALRLNEYPDADMIYSDEDKIDDGGNFSEPHFKPDWSPDSFLSRMYTCHFGVYRRELADAIGGLRVGYEGSQDHDFVLRLTERSDRIHHISRVLYHWRIHPASTSAAADAKPYAAIAGQRAIQDAIERRGEPGVVERSEIPGIYVTRYAIRDAGLVSVIVPTRDHGEDVERCLGSIFRNDAYPNFELILVDNGSKDRASLETFARWEKRESRVRVVRYDKPFNFSAINNYAVERSSGKYTLFLNNDTEVISGDWMHAMVEQAQRPSIGVVGGLLLYPDDTIQHAGVVVGLGGVAGHGQNGLHRNDPGYFGSVRAVNNFSALTAACVMIRRSVFDEVGGFDERLAVAFNDVDLSLKIARAGYHNVYLPHVMLYHYESKSRGAETTPEMKARFAREVALMEERWSTRTVPDPCYSPHLSLDAPGYAIRL